MKVKFIIITCMIFILIPGLSLLHAAEDAEADDNPVKVLDNLTIDTVKKEIRLKASLALEMGILEFFLVDEMGQTYESVFKIVDNKPSELHFALLLLGFEPVPFPEYQALITSKDAVASLKAQKALLRIEILKDDKPIPVASLFKVREAAAAYPDYWVFTGGYFTETNKYAADLAMIYISIWPEQSSVINLLSAAGNPYRGNLGFEIAAGHKYALDDEFTLVIKGVQ